MSSLFIYKPVRLRVGADDELVGLTIVGVSDTVLEDSVPLLLLFLRYHTEVVVTGVWVPQDQRELGGTLEEG